MKDFHGFYGQDQIVSFLKIQLTGAKALGKTMPHLLLSGGSGMGKTKLADSMAKEYGSACHRIVGKPSVKRICEQAVRLEQGDFLLFDEAHNLKHECQEALYELIDTWRLKDHFQGVYPPGVDVTLDNHGKIVVQPCTVLLATDQPGRLLEALLRRLKHRVMLSSYKNEELEEIGRTTAGTLGVVVSDEAVKKIAEACQGQPRRMEQILEGIQLFFHKNRRGEVRSNHVVQYLQSAGIDSFGLDPIQQDYLCVLGKLSVTSLETLGHQLDTDPDYIRSQVEPGLKRKCFIVIGKGGRELTTLGKMWYTDWKAVQKTAQPKQEGGEE